MQLSREFRHEMSDDSLDAYGLCPEKFMTETATTFEIITSGADMFPIEKSGFNIILGGLGFELNMEEQNDVFEKLHVKEGEKIGVDRFRTIVQACSQKVQKGNKDDGDGEESSVDNARIELRYAPSDIYSMLICVELLSNDF